MIRNYDAKDPKCTVILLDGTIYKNCDVHGLPINEAGNVINFWVSNSLMVVPMHQVKRVRFHDGEQE